MKRSKAAVFLDRDGTLLTERGYLSDPKEMVFYPGVFAPLRRLQRRGFKLVVITNQSGLARGYFSLATFRKINARFKALLARNGVRIDGIYFCPHYPGAGCACRKPKALLPQKAARELGIDLKKSYVIGDQWRDIRMARNIGATGVLVLTGAGRASRDKAAAVAGKIARNMKSASAWILSDKEKSDDK